VINSFSDFIILSFAVVKYIMIIQSLDLPSKILIVLKKTENSWLRLVMAKAGMTIDCTVCLSVVGGIIAVAINALGLNFINMIMATSVLGLILKRKYL